MSTFYSQVLDGSYSARQQEAGQAAQSVPVHLPLKYQPRPGESAIAYIRRLQPVLPHLELENEETQLAVQLAYQQAIAAIEQVEQEARAELAAGRSWLGQRDTGSGVGIFGRDEDVVGHGMTRGSSAGSSVII